MYVQRRKRRQLWSGASPYQQNVDKSRQSYSQSESALESASNFNDSESDNRSVATVAVMPYKVNSPSIFSGQARTVSMGNARSRLNEGSQVEDWLESISEKRESLAFPLTGLNFAASSSAGNRIRGEANSQQLLIAQQPLFDSPCNLKGSVCRFCQAQLSTTSNRHRHERLKHPSELNSLIGSAPGNSRKATAESAFASLSVGQVLVPDELIEVQAANIPQAFVLVNVAADELKKAEGDQVNSREVVAAASFQPPELVHSVANDRGHSNSIAASIGARAAIDGSVAMELDQDPDSAAVIDLSSDEADHTSHDQPGSASRSSRATAYANQLFANSPALLAILEAFESETATIQPHPNPVSESKQIEGAPAEAPVLDSWQLPTADSMRAVEGVRALLREEDLQHVCYPFLQWLANPPITQVEALVKARRIKTMAQLQPIKSNLRFIFALLYESQVVNTIQLTSLIELPICQALYQTIVDRQVGSGRVHAIFLLVKKVLVYLSSVDSTRSRQFVQPTAYESYLYVESICSDSSNQRKADARNRMVLGMPGNHGTLAVPKEAFQIPKTWTTSSPAAPASTGPAQVAAAATNRALQQNSSARNISGSSSSDPAVMTKLELQKVTQACLAYLTTQVSNWSQGNSATSVVAHAADLTFTHYLVTATLCLGLAPRSQVLQQLKIGSSFTKADDGRYWVKMLAEQSKNGKPTMFALANELTVPYDAYLQLVRPRLLTQSSAASSTSEDHNYVFMKRNGAVPRTDFSSSTCLVTQRILGRPINAHAFRSSVITTFYSAGASQADMDMLANIMAHDPATARNFYYKPQHSQAAVQTSERMVEQLLPSNLGTAAEVNCSRSANVQMQG